MLRLTIRCYYSLLCALLLGVALVGFSAHPARAQGVKALPAGEITSGKLQYRAHCASCHGMDGKGNGPVAPALKQSPTDLTLLAEKNGGTFPEEKVANAINGTTAVTSHGTREMPIWGRTIFLRQKTGLITTPLTPSEVNERVKLIVDYVKSIQKK